MPPLEKLFEFGYVSVRRFRFFSRSVMAAEQVSRTECALFTTPLAGSTRGVGAHREAIVAREIEIHCQEGDRSNLESVDFFAPPIALPACLLGACVLGKAKTTYFRDQDGRGSNMNRRPMTFGDLIARVARAPAVDAVAMSPIIASAVELKGDGGPSDRRMWVVIHSVTDAELRLIHPGPFQSSMVAVEISSPTGEILRVVLEPAGSRQEGELFETCARFLQLGRGMLSASA